jgi:hypothetical protein
MSSSSHRRDESQCGKDTSRFLISRNGILQKAEWGQQNNSGFIITITMNSVLTSGITLYKECSVLQSKMV